MNQKKIRAERFFSKPIIYPHMDKWMGSNINGPSIIRMPNWCKNRLGKYYLYFSDHKGKYIRLAFSDNLTGPWKLYSPGVLNLKESLFISKDPSEPPEDERPPWAKKMKGGYLYAHIASPDVHCVQENKIFKMYYHGLLSNGDQVTRIATSLDGLKFLPLEPILGPPYFRVFQFQGHLYALTWGAEIWRSDDWHLPFIKGPKILPYDPKEGVGSGFRHGEVFLRGKVLHIFFTNIGDQPERIIHTTISLHSDWMKWAVKEQDIVLEPELVWEGADLNKNKSVMGAITERVRELRDPCIFEDDDGTVYLLYCGAGENGIGIVKIHNI